jgi:hypothetical protein
MLEYSFCLLTVITTINDFLLKTKKELAFAETMYGTVEIITRND